MNHPSQITKTNTPTYNTSFKFNVYFHNVEASLGVELKSTDIMDDYAQQKDNPDIRVYAQTHGKRLALQMSQVRCIVQC